MVRYMVELNDNTHLNEFVDSPIKHTKELTSSIEIELFNTTKWINDWNEERIQCL